MRSASMFRPERQNADDLNDETRVLAVCNALEHLAVDDDMRALVDSVRKFSHDDQLHIVRRQAVKTLRRRVNILGLVQYQNRNRIYAVTAREFAKVDSPREI